MAFDPVARGLAAKASNLAKAGDSEARDNTASARLRNARFAAATLAGQAPKEASKAYLQVVTTRNETQRFLGSATTAANVKHVSRTRKYIGQADVLGFTLSSQDFAMPSAAESVETDGGPCTLRTDAEVGGVCVVGSYGGAPSKALAAGATDDQSDMYLPAQFGLQIFKAGSAIYIKEEREYAVGAIPTYINNLVLNPAVPGESMLRGATDAPSKIGVPGTMASGGGWATATTLSSPIVLGVTAREIPSLGIIGASIEERLNDSGGDGTAGSGGYVARALAADPKIAYYNLARAGESAADNVASGMKRAAMYRYLTHVINAEGGNDFTDNRTIAQYIADMRTLNKRLKDAGVSKVYQLRLFPKTNSTSAWADLAGQTVRTNSASMSFLDFRAQADAAALTDPNCDGIIDLTPAVESQVETGKWLPGMTDDGTHPTPAAHGTIASLFRVELGKRGI